MKKTDFRMDPSKPADNTSHVVEPPTKAYRETSLETAGWRSGDAADFLGMDDDERKILDARVAELKSSVRGAAGVFEGEEPGVIASPLLSRACDVNQDCPCTPLTRCQNLPSEPAFSVAEQKSGPSGCGLEDCDIAAQPGK